MRIPVPFERRLDRRHALAGHACVVRIATAGPELFGGIVDVGARGVRLRVRPGIVLEPGDACHVHLVVSLPSGAPDGPPVRLHGRAAVVRRVEFPDRSEEIALRFDEPLRVGEAFSTSLSATTAHREPSSSAGLATSPA